MDDNSHNRVGEAHSTFNVEGAVVSPRADGQVYRAKVFKSGNSLALRLPKALGLEAGMEMDIEVLAGGAMALRKAEPPRRKIDISGFAGKAPGIRLAPREDFEERPSTIAAREAARKAAEKA